MVETKPNQSLSCFLVTWIWLSSSPRLIFCFLPLWSDPLEDYACLDVPPPDRTRTAHISLRQLTWLPLCLICSHHRSLTEATPDTILRLPDPIPRQPQIEISDCMCTSRAPCWRFPFLYAIVLYFKAIEMPLNVTEYFKKCIELVWHIMMQHISKPRTSHFLLVFMRCFKVDYYVNAQ